MHVTWGISKPACLPKASHHLLNVCFVILLTLVPCAFCTTAQPQLATAETGCHVHSGLQYACKHKLCAHVDCQCVCHTGVTGRQTSITLCTQPAIYQALPSAVVPEPGRKAEDATSNICHVHAGFERQQSWQMSRRLPHSAGCCTEDGSCPRTAWFPDLGQV